VDFLDLGWVKSDALLAVEVKLTVLPRDILFKLVTINGVGFDLWWHCCFIIAFAESKAEFTEWTTLKLVETDTPLSPFNFHIRQLRQSLRLYLFKIGYRWHLDLTWNCRWPGTTIVEEQELFAPSCTMRLCISKQQTLSWWYWHHCLNVWRVLKIAWGISIRATIPAHFTLQ